MRLLRVFSSGKENEEHRDVSLKSRQGASPSADTLMDAQRGSRQNRALGRACPAGAGQLRTWAAGHRQVLSELARPQENVRLKHKQNKRALRDHSSITAGEPVRREGRKDWRARYCLPPWGRVHRGKQWLCFCPVPLLGLRSTCFGPSSSDIRCGLRPSNVCLVLWISVFSLVKLKF